VISKTKKRDDFITLFYWADGFHALPGGSKTNGNMRRSSDRVALPSKCPARHAQHCGELSSRQSMPSSPGPLFRKQL
jgi:hypothetical protein